jgi:large subunit ribosomal protein L36e
MAKKQPSVIALGKYKGHPTNKLAKRKRPVATKAKLGKRTQLIREVVNEISGVTSYEKRAV